MAKDWVHQYNKSTWDIFHILGEIINVTLLSGNHIIYLALKKKVLAAMVLFLWSCLKVPLDRSNVLLVYWQNKNKKKKKHVCPAMIFCIFIFWFVASHFCHFSKCFVIFFPLFKNRCSGANVILWLTG